MHPSALRNAKRFFQTYTKNRSAATVLDIGSQDVNGSLKDVMPAHLTYTGIDFVNGKNVDVVITDPYQLPFENGSIDIVISSSCFEHSEMFWVLFLEIMRVLRPGGLLYLNVPTNGMFHRYPVDCWRFYPDSGQALVTWGKRNGMNPLLLESFVSPKFMGLWNDFVAVILKDTSMESEHLSRMIELDSGNSNGRVSGMPNLVRLSEESPDQSSFLDRLKRRYWMSQESRVMQRIRLGHDE